MNPAPELLSFAEADDRLDAALSASFQGSYESVLFFPGDVTLDGDFLAAVTELAGGQEYHIVAIAGDLTVNGPIRLYENFPGLYVTGYTRGETLEGGDAEIYIQQGTFTYLVYGYYNHGILDTGTVQTPWVINSDHDLRVIAPGATIVDNYGDADSADFMRKNIAESFVAEVVDTRHQAAVAVPVFLERLRAGLPVLLPGARTHLGQVLADVARAKADRLPTLDLTDRKLTEVPADVLDMPWLHTLVLDRNPIKRLPDRINVLSELEHLSVRHCRLTALPDSIGELTRLRVLRVAHNSSWETAFVLPETVGRLVGLEELDVSGLSGSVEGDTDPLPEKQPFTLPDSCGALLRLRRLVADRTNLVIPESMHGLPALREIQMSGSSSGYLRRFPAYVTTFPQLRELDLSGNIFEEIPDSVLGLANLEELDLGDALGLVRELPDLSGLPKLRVLGMSGRVSHTGVPVPAHGVLRPLFGMRLASLADLRIDRWGGDNGRGPLTADVIAGIGAFRELRRLDLSFNGLADVPDDFYALPALAEIDLRYNALSRDVRQRIAATYPNARIDFRNQRGTTDDEEEELFVVDGVLKEADAARYRRDWPAALEGYEQAIAALRDGESSHALLYSYYHKMWIHGTIGYGHHGTAADRADHRHLGVATAQACMYLVPPVWQARHLTDEGEFHREVVRYATNFIAWEVIDGDPAPSAAELTRALELIERGGACGTESWHVNLRDTRARLLLALGREADAWPVVREADALSPEFGPLRDLTLDERYQAWLRDLQTSAE